MIRTPVCDLLAIDHPIALGGMGSATSPELVSAVSNAGGLGALGCHYLSPEQIDERTAAIRKQTNKPFGLNFLLFDTREDSFAASLESPNVRDDGRAVMLLPDAVRFVVPVKEPT